MSGRWGRVLLFVAAAWLARAPGKPVSAQESAVSRDGREFTGTASRYHHELVGGRTASGERYHPDSLTASHRTLPFGTWVRVTHQGNGRAVLVRINDRGPFRPAGRVLDLSARAADELGVRSVARVRIVVVDSAEVAALRLLARLDALLAGQAGTPAPTLLAPVRPVSPAFRPSLPGRRSLPSPGNPPRS